MRRFIGICFLIATFLCGILIPQGVALAARNTPIILLSGEEQGDEIVVTATLRSNDGINAMLLTLEYDQNYLSLVSSERGSALASMDYMTGVREGKSRFNWMGDANDATNGTLIKMTFRRNSSVQTGETDVTFSYNGKTDVNYIDADGELQTTRIAIDSLHLTFSDGKVEKIETVDSDATEEQPAKKEVNVTLIVGLTVGGVFLCSIVAVTLILLKKKKII